MSAAQTRRLLRAGTPSSTGATHLFNMNPPLRTSHTPAPARRAQEPSMRTILRDDGRREVARRDGAEKPRRGAAPGAKAAAPPASITTATADLAMVGMLARTEAERRRQRSNFPGGRLEPFSDKPSTTERFRDYGGQTGDGAGIDDFRDDMHAKTVDGRPLAAARGVPGAGEGGGGEQRHECYPVADPGAGASKMGFDLTARRLCQRDEARLKRRCWSRPPATAGFFFSRENSDPQSHFCKGTNCIGVRHRQRQVAASACGRHLPVCRAERLPWKLTDSRLPWNQPCRFRHRPGTNAEWIPVVKSLTKP